MREIFLQMSLFTEKKGHMRTERKKGVRTGKLNFEVSDIPSMANKISLRPPPPWENFLDRAIEDCVLLFDKDKFKTKKKKLKPQLG